MLRPKRITPLRAAPEDPSKDNPLHALKESFAEWTTAIGLSPQTANIRKSALGHFIRWCHGRQVESPGAIDRDLLEAYQAHLAAWRKANGDLLELSTQATRLNPLKAFCKWLVRRRLLASDPSRELILPRLPKRLPRRVPSVSEIKAIIASAAGDALPAIRDRAIMETLYSSGLRRMELARLRTAEVDFGSRSIIVRAGKGSRDRVVPIGAVATAWIGRYLHADLSTTQVYTHVSIGKLREVHAATHPAM